MDENCTTERKIKRRPKAERKFQRTLNPSPDKLSVTAYDALLRISLGKSSKLEMRKKLASAGLITSHVFSKAAITKKGRVTLDAGRPHTVVEIAAVEAAPPSLKERIAALRELYGGPRDYMPYHNPHRRPGCWG